jgi:tricarballylate dehydrogenase
MLVVGCGVAGLSAAVTALEAGLTTVNLERATPQHFGGNSRWNEAYLRMKNDREVSDDFEDHFARNPGVNLDPNVQQAAGDGYAQWPAYVKSHPFPDPELISAFAASVPPTIAWLKGFGLKFEPTPIYLLTQNTTRIAAKGGGLAIIEALREHALRRGGEIRYRTTAVDLLRDDGGRVRGVLAIGPDGVRQTIAARNVILASGGFEGNAEMLTHYLGACRARHIRPVAIGGYYNRGEGIRMALAAGAAPAGEFGSYHAEPIDPRSLRAEAVVFIYPYGILVNRHAQRFVDESPGTVDAHYDEITRSFADQPGGLVHVIFDAKVEEIPRWKTSIRSDLLPIRADTIEALAAKIDLDPAALSSTVRAFNAACPSTAAFEPFALDGRRTQGITPPKSHWSRPIDQAPYFAYPIIAANCFTFGGVKVNADAQVLTHDGHVIPGLYAAGETMGIYHQVYAGATSVLRGLVFGRRAGQHIAKVSKP